MLAIVVVACAVASTPAFADASQPVGLSAVARSDHLVELTWSWPATPTYPDELDVYRDGTFVSSVLPASSTAFSDTIQSLSAPGTTHSYYLVTVTGGVAGTPTASTPPVTLRADLPNKPTNVAASFGAGNLATVTWKRGPMDADVTYTVTAQPAGGGGPINTGTVKYPDDGTAGSLTMDGFNSYTDYVFTVSAVEDVGDPAGDPGGTANAGSSATAQSFDVIAPQFSGGTLPTATTVSLGTITVTWPPATDAGSGVASYTVCIDGGFCTSVPFDPLSVTQSATPGAGLIRNNGASHTVSVVAVDNQSNQSVPIAQQITMPLPATPVLALSAVNGCAPLIVTPTSSDGGSPSPTFHVFADGSTEVPFGPGNPVAGAPYQVVALTASASYGLDSSPTSATYLAHVEDPTPPALSPEVHGTGSDTNSGTETLDWDGVTEPTGAPVIGYMVTSSTIPGYGDGKFVAQLDHVQLQLTGLTPSDGYTVDVTSVDACQRTSPVPDRIHFIPNDNSPPTAPVLNTPVVGGNDVKLSWAPSTDNVAVDDYIIYKFGIKVGETTGTSADVTPLPESYTATYTVVAIDTAGNRSSPSAPRTATTLDMTPPGPPGALRPIPQGGNISLSWGAATDNVAVAGYQLSRLADGQTTPTLVYQGTSLSFTDKNVPAGSYTYSVVAFDAASHVSTPRTATATSTGTPIATKASTVRVVKSKGTRMFVVGGASGARIVLLFRLKQPFARAVVRLQVLKTGVTGKAVTKLRISLPAGSGRTTPGKRLGERIARKGTISIPVGHMKAGVLRLVVTATGGTLTLAGTSSAHAPTIVAGS
jgi:Fibronectin type III domain